MKLANLMMANLMMANPMISGIFWPVIRLFGANFNARPSRRTAEVLAGICCYRILKGQKSKPFDVVAVLVMIVDALKHPETTTTTTTAVHPAASPVEPPA